MYQTETGPMSKTCLWETQYIQWTMSKGKLCTAYDKVFAAPGTNTMKNANARKIIKYIFKNEIKK